MPKGMGVQVPPRALFSPRTRSAERLFEAPPLCGMGGRFFRDSSRISASFGASPVLRLFPRSDRAPRLFGLGSAGVLARIIPDGDHFLHFGAVGPGAHQTVNVTDEGDAVGSTPRINKDTVAQAAAFIPGFSDFEEDNPMGVERMALAREGREEFAADKTIVGGGKASVFGVESEHRRCDLHDVVFGLGSGSGGGAHADPRKKENVQDRHDPDGEKNDKDRVAK